MASEDQATTRRTALTVVPAETEFEIFYRREFSNLAVLAGTIAEALAKAHRDWPRVSTLDKPGAWVRRVTINLAIGRKRRSLSEAKALFRLGPPAEKAAETRRGDPAVWAAVDELPPRQRAVVALHYLEDQSVKEIAEILEISVSAATSNLHKARTNLAATLGENYG